MQIQKLLSGPTCLVWQLMSLTATEKQVHLDRLHMRPIQWHLNINWRVPVSLKGDPHSQITPPHLKWWLQEDNVLQGQPLHPLLFCKSLQMHQRRVGCSLGQMLQGEPGPFPERKLHIKPSGTKRSLLGP